MTAAPAPLPVPYTGQHEHGRAQHEAIEREAIELGRQIAATAPLVSELRERAADPDSSLWLRGRNKDFADNLERDIRLEALRAMLAASHGDGTGRSQFIRWYAMALHAFLDAQDAKVAA